MLIANSSNQTNTLIMHIYSPDILPEPRKSNTKKSLVIFDIQQNLITKQSLTFEFSHIGINIYELRNPHQ